MITYCIPTYNRQDLLPVAINAAMSGSITPDKIVIVDNGSLGKAADVVVNATYNIMPNLEIIDSDENLGCAITWNMFMRNNEDYIIIANDDVTVHHHTIITLVGNATRNPDKPMFTGSGHSGNSFSLFLLRKWAWELLGEFDEHFKPAYFEDNDWHYRMKLVGLDFTSLPDATFDHVGSGTVKAMCTTRQTIHHHKFLRNQQYYIKKWGGIPGQEKYTIPFNGENMDIILEELKNTHMY